MSLLDTASPSKLQLQAKARNAISSSVRQLFLQMQNVFNTNFNLVWSNPDGLTPQEVLDGMGPDAASLFQYAALLQDCVNGAKPGTLTQTPPNAVTFNQDGTVTVGAAV